MYYQIYAFLFNFIEINNIENRRNIACNNKIWGPQRLLSDVDDRLIERLLHHKAIKISKNSTKSVGKDVSSWTVLWKRMFLA